MLLHFGNIWLIYDLYSYWVFMNSLYVLTLSLCFKKEIYLPSYTNLYISI